MYKEFYGFTTYPFSITPDPQFLYLSRNYEACLHYLSYSLERGHGLIVLTGETGTGKTLLLKNFAKDLNEKTHIAFLVNSALDSFDMLLYAFHEITARHPAVNIDVVQINEGLRKLLNHRSTPYCFGSFAGKNITTSA